MKVTYYFKVVIFIASVLFTTNINGSNLKKTLTGKIKDAESANNIEYASVALYNQNDSTLITGAISNSDGIFVIENISAGNYFVRISCLGYQEQRLNVSVEETQKTVNIGEISLQINSENISEVIVSAERRAIEYHIDKDVINVAQSSNNSGSMMSNVLAGHPAIEAGSDGSVKLRGSTNFIVLIDGKPTSDESTDILNQIPATNIDKVEIITNPSARYDANHAAGIVNLITRKSEMSGFSGIFNSSVSNAERNNANLSLNYKTGKVSVFVQADYYHSPIFQDRSSFEKRVVNGESGFQDFHSDNILLWEGKSVNTGIDYYLNERNTLSAYVNRSSSVFGWSPQKTISEGTSLDTSYYILDDFMRNYRDAWHFNLSDIHRFSNSGNEISFDANVIVVDMSRKNNQYQYNSNVDWIEKNLAEEYHLKRYQYITRQQYRVDYSLPINTNKLESGLMLKLDSRTIRNNIVTQKYQGNDEDINKDEYKANNDLFAFYSTFLCKVLKSELQVGLRLEYVDRNTILTNGGFSKAYHQLTFFPNVNLSRRLSANQKIRFSYGRSIWRPTDLQLNPTIYFRDISGEFSGNAELQPSYTNSFELSHNLVFGEHSLSAKAFYRHTQNNIMTVRYLNENSVYRNNPENLQGGQRDIGIELSGNMKFNKWLEINPGGNFYNGYIHGDITGQTIDRRSDVWSLRIITNIKPSKTTNAKLNAYYNSPTLGDQVTMSEIYGLSFSVKQELFQNKLSLSISGDDILRTEKRKFTVEGEDFKQQITDKFPKHPILSFNLTLKLNNFTRKNRENVEGGIGFN